jgi:ABC-type multidrug transport system permease subunit
VIPIVGYSLKRKLTDKATLINMIVMPLLLILILGNALSSTFHRSSSGGGPKGLTTLAVLDQDGTPASAQLLSFLHELNTTFALSTVTSQKDGEAALSSQKAEVLLSVAKGYAAGTTSGGGPIHLYAVDSNIDHLRAAQIALDSFSDGSRATAASAANAANGSAPIPYTMVDSSGAQAATTSSDPSAGVSGITYYSVTLLVLILIYGMGNTMNFVKEEYEGPLGDRYLTTSTSKFTLVAGQVVSGVVSSMVQAVVMVLAAVLLFRADYGSSPLAALGVIAVAVLLFNAVGLLLGLLGRTRPWLDPLLSLAIPAMTFVGGGFVKLDFGGLENYTVNSIFQNGLFKEISGAAVPWSQMYTCLAVAGASLVLSAVMLNRTETR